VQGLEQTLVGNLSDADQAAVRRWLAGVASGEAKS
jgi:hypothetical protein